MMASATSTRDVIIQQIDELLLKLISQSEESLLITADGESLYVTGSDKGKTFLAENKHIAENFHNFCYGTSLEPQISNSFTKGRFVQKGESFPRKGKPNFAKHAFTVFNLPAVGNNDEEGEETTQELQQTKKNDFPVFNIQSQTYPGPGNHSRKPPGETSHTRNTWKGNLNNMKSFKVEICQKNNKAQIKLSPLKEIKEKSGGPLKKDTLRTSKSSNTAVNKSDGEAQDLPRMTCSDSSHLGSSKPASTIQGESFEISDEESHVQSPKIPSPSKAGYSDRIDIDSKLSSSSKENHSKKSVEKDKSVCEKEDVNLDELMIAAEDYSAGPDECREGNPSHSNQCDVEEEETSLIISHVRENSELDEDGIKLVAKESDSVADSPQSGNLNQKTSSSVTSSISSKSKEIAKKNSPDVKGTEVDASASVYSKNLKEVSHTEDSQLNLETPDSLAIVKHAQSQSLDKKSTEEAQGSSGDVQVKDTGSHSGDKQTTEDGESPKKSNLARRCKEIPPANTAADTSSTRTKGKDKLERGSRKRKRTQSATRLPMKKKKDVSNSETDQVSEVSTMDSLPGDEATESLNMLKEDQNIQVHLVKEMSKSPLKNLKKSPERKQGKEKLNGDPVTSPKTKHDETGNLKTLIVKLEKIPNIQNYGKSVQKGSSLHHTTHIQKLNSIPSADLKKSRKQEKNYSEPLHPAARSAVTAKPKLRSRKHVIITDQSVPDSLFPRAKNVDKTAAESLEPRIKDVGQHETEFIQVSSKDIDHHETESVQVSSKDVNLHETESVQVSSKDVNHHETESVQVSSKDVNHHETESVQVSSKDVNHHETESPKQYTKDVDQPEKEFKKLHKKSVDNNASEAIQSCTDTVDQSESESILCLKESVDKPLVELKKATLKKRREFSKKSEKRCIENTDDSAEMSLHVKDKFSSKPPCSNFIEKPQKKLNTPSIESIGECSSNSKKCKLEKHIKPVLGKGIPDLKNFSLDLKTLSSQLQKLKKP